LIDNVGPDFVQRAIQRHGIYPVTKPVDLATSSYLDYLVPVRLKIRSNVVCYVIDVVSSCPEQLVDQALYLVLSAAADPGFRMNLRYDAQSSHAVPRPSSLYQPKSSVNQFPKQRAQLFGTAQNSHGIASATAT
jgi:hypothetical protein